MQRKFLEDLGLEKEVIDKIMSENGNDIEKAKSKLEAERDSYKEQLDKATETLKTFDGVNVEELKNKVATLTNDLAESEKKHGEKLAELEFNSVLDSAVSASGTRNTKALKALLDVEKLRTSKNQGEDIKAAIEAVKAENDYLFVSNEPIKNPVAPTNNPSVVGITKEAFAKMGYGERVNLKRNNPEKYKELKG